MIKLISRRQKSKRRKNAFVIDKRSAMMIKDVPEKKVSYCASPVIIDRGFKVNLPQPNEDVNRLRTVVSRKDAQNGVRLIVD